MAERAVIDRIVDETYAVLLVGDPPVREVSVEVSELPPGAREGHWLFVDLAGDRLEAADIDEEGTRRARSRVREKLGALRRRGRGERRR